MKGKTLIFVLCILSLLMAGCGGRKEPVSSSGAGIASAEISLDAEGLTTEQRNVRNRIQLEGTGSIKHLYVISPYSGQVIIYSTVYGKVTSSGKRLRPNTADSGSYYGDFVIPGIADSAGNVSYTNEVIQDDGTYGSSVEYIYWWDAQGRYHQHFFTGGQIIHVSDQPIPVTNIILNLELVDD